MIRFANGKPKPNPLMSSALAREKMVEKSALFPAQRLRRPY
jgi:hypothetical protein